MHVTIIEFNRPQTLIFCNFHNFPVFLEDKRPLKDKLQGTSQGSSSWHRVVSLFFFLFAIFACQSWFTAAESVKAAWVRSPLTEKVQRNFALFVNLLKARMYRKHQYLHCVNAA